MDFEPLIEKKRGSLADLEKAMSVPGFYDDAEHAAKITREYNRTGKLLDLWSEFNKARSGLAESRELAKSEDGEMAAMAEEEIPELEEKIPRLEQEITLALLPPDPAEERDVIVEVRAGTGGDEASLFAGDLYSMYSRLGEKRGWTLEMLEASPSGVGGFKELVFKVSGEDAYNFLKYESGVHRVQRVPETETQGRIHTSTATVAVMPEAREVDVELKPDELHIQATRSGGPGGQHVNTTDSAVQVTHLPTGLMVKCQDGRSQGKNKEKALAILRAKLMERKKQEEEEKYSSHRRSLIGSGGREEKIRTYNFPQSRLTDHRVGYTGYNLEQVMEGQLEDVFDKLRTSEMEERLDELEAEME